MSNFHSHLHFLKLEFVCTYPIHYQSATGLIRNHQKENYSLLSNENFPISLHFEKEESQKQIRERAANVGFQFANTLRKRVYNTFNCHRLLHWAHEELGAHAQHALKTELLVAYFRLGDSLDDAEALLKAVDRAHLDRQRALEILNSDIYTEEVRHAEESYRQLGISAVPSIIFNDRHLLQGGQPVELFEQAIRQIAQEQS